MTLTNHDSQPHELELTSYAEVTLNPRRADQAHPAFGKLFLETEFLPDRAALLVPPAPPRPGPEADLGGPRPVGGRPRRRRSQYETDRAASWAAAVAPPTPPPWTRGRSCRAPPARCSTRSSACAAASASGRADRPPSPSRPRRPRAGKSPGPGRSVPEFRRPPRPLTLPGPQPDRAARPRPVAGRGPAVPAAGGYVIYTGPAFRPPAAVAANRLGQPGLWPHGISGDRPIVLGPRRGGRPAADPTTAPGPRLLAASKGWRWTWSSSTRPRRRPGGAARQLGWSWPAGAAPAPDGQAGRRVPAAGAGSPRTTGSCSRPRPGSCSRAAAVLWPPSSTARRPPPQPAALPDPDRASRRVTGPGHAVTGARPAVLQRPRRLHPGRPRVRDPPGRGAAAAPAPWVNVLANPGFGFLVTEAARATPGRATAR